MQLEVSTDTIRRLRAQGLILYEKGSCQGYAGFRENVPNITGKDTLRREWSLKLVR